MHHFEKIARGLADQGLDAMLLTGEANRFYASGFHSAGTDGVALVTKEKAYYFTDSAYTEAAGALRPRRGNPGGGPGAGGIRCCWKERSSATTLSAWGMRTRT